MNTQELFDLLNHLAARGEQQDEIIEIKADEIVRPKFIQISVNGADNFNDSRVVISGSFVNVKGQDIKGMPVAMTLEDAADFAQGILNAVEFKARELEGNDGE